MKATLGLLAMATLVMSVQAGPEVIIRERAKELRNENNVRQGVPPPTQAQQPANSTAARPPGPALPKFQTDLAAIKMDAVITPALSQTLAQDLSAATPGAKPSLLALLQKLAEDIAMAASAKPLPLESRARLAQELDAILNPNKYPQAKPDGIVTDVQAIFQANGLQRSKAVVIADDVKAISAAVRSGA